MHELIQDITFSIVTAWILGSLPPSFSASLRSWPTSPAASCSALRACIWCGPEASIHVISELGLILMLFMIGLEIDLKKIVRAGSVIIGASRWCRSRGPASLASLFFWLILAEAARWDPLYLGVAAALSSTVIIVKVLYEKRELDTLPGRITLGILVLQDLFAILFLAVQPNLGNLQLSILALSVGRVFVLVGAALVISRFVLPWIFHRIARSPELVLVGRWPGAFWWAKSASGCICRARWAR